MAFREVLQRAEATVFSTGSNPERNAAVYLKYVQEFHLGHLKNFGPLSALFEEVVADPSRPRDNENEKWDMQLSGLTNGDGNGTLGVHFTKAKEKPGEFSLVHLYYDTVKGSLRIQGLETTFNEGFRKYDDLDDVAGWREMQKRLEEGLIKAFDNPDILYSTPRRTIPSLTGLIK